MTPAASTHPARSELLWALAFGLYGTAVALAPGMATKAVLCTPLVLLPLVWWLLGSANRWLALFFATAWLLPPLPISLGNSGPHAAVLIAAMGLFIGLLRLPEWQFQPDIISLTMGGLFAILLASGALAAVYSGTLIAAGSLARVALFGISVYMFFYLRNGPAFLNERDRLRFTRILFAIGAGSALFACVDFYFQFPAPTGFGSQFIWLDTGVFRRAQGFFYEASTLGNLCAFFIEMMIVALLRPRATRILPAWALLAGGAVFATALVLSYSRASLVNIGVALAVLVWFHRKRIGMLRLLTGLGLSGAFAAVLLLELFPDFAHAYLLRVTTSFQYFFQAPNAILSGRLQNWALLKDFLIAQPWHALLGIGYKTLPYSDFAGNVAIADNTYLSMLIETGIGGLLAVFALHAVILRGSYQAARSADSNRSFFGMWMLCFWSGEIVQMLSGDLLTYWRVLPAYFCVFALAMRE